MRNNLHRYQALVIGQAKPNDRVICIRDPDVSFFECHDLLFFHVVRGLPMPGVLYTVRSAACLATHGSKMLHGLHLKEIKNDAVIILGDPKGEPFFEVSCFSFVC